MLKGVQDHLRAVPCVLEHELMRQRRLLLFIGAGAGRHCSARLTRSLQIPHSYQLVLPTAGKYTCASAHLSFCRCLGVQEYEICIEAATANLTHTAGAVSPDKSKASAKAALNWAAGHECSARQ